MRNGGCAANGGGDEYSIGSLEKSLLNENAAKCIISYERLTYTKTRNIFGMCVKVNISELLIYLGISF